LDRPRDICGKAAQLILRTSLEIRMEEPGISKQHVSPTHDNHRRWPMINLNEMMVDVRLQT
jgi:hypothetical protein